MGGLFQESMSWSQFGFQFLNVHLLLFGGATAYNSWWDKDEGAVGGLRHPPPMNRWMWTASLVIQFVGLGLASLSGPWFALIYVTSMIFFWLYSTPHARWKGKPVHSLVAIGVSTGTNSFLLGYLAAGSRFEPVALLASIGVGLVILSLYPTSQVYQVEEDRRRGDQTFAVYFGRDAVFTFFRAAFGTGILLLSVALAVKTIWVGAGFMVLGGLTAGTVNHLLSRLTLQSSDYDRVMRIKYGTSLAFVLFLTGGIWLKHYLDVVLL